jgi:hypothetical protein
LSSSWPSWLFEEVANQVFADNADIFDIYAEMGNDERTELQLKFQDS